MKRNKIFSVSFCMIIIVSMFNITFAEAKVAGSEKIKNIIYMIPDGGGM